MYLGPIGAVIGLIVSLYIRIQKRKKTKLICPREANCEKVIHSIHSKTIGIPNEILGIIYYSTIGIIYALTLFYPAFSTSQIDWLILMMTSIGAVFSVYLIALQALVIRAWCMWCLASAFASLLLVLALFERDLSGVFQILSNQRVFWIIMHNIGFILGVGGATITDVFFFRFLKDNVISEEEKGTMDTLTSVIWVGLAILIISGLMLYLPNQARLDISAKFQLKVVVVAVIALNGLLLNMLVAPKMRSFSFEQTKPAKHLRKIAFALGGISIVSWYSAFLLGSIRRIDTDFFVGISAYIALLVGVVLGSQIFEKIITKKNNHDVIHGQGGQGHNKTL